MYSYWQLRVHHTPSLAVLRHWCLYVGFRYGEAVYAHHELMGQLVVVCAS